MSSVRLRRLSAAAIAATAVLALSGCSPLGENLQTNKQYSAGVGSNARGQHVEVLNSLFVDNGDKTATYSAALLNRDPEAHTLTGVDVTTTDGTAITSTFATPRELKDDTPYNPGTEGDIILTGAFPAGGFVKITFNFDNAAPVTVSAPIVTRTAIYDSIATKTIVPAPSARTSTDPTALTPTDTATTTAP